MMIASMGMGISMFEQTADELEIYRNAGLILPGQAIEAERVVKRR